MGIAESLAGIVALIGQYRAERGSSAQSDFNDFIEWLTKTNHQEIKELLLLNTKATIGVKAILNQDHEVMFQYLERIDQALAAFSSNIEGFSELAAGIKPDSILSEQALSILVQFENAGASKASETNNLQGLRYYFLDGKTGYLEISDRRFIEDDFRSLLELGLLRLSSNSKGEALYIITRAAAALVKSQNS